MLQSQASFAAESDAVGRFAQGAVVQDGPLPEPDPEFLDSLRAKADAQRLVDALRQEGEFNPASKPSDPIALRPASTPEPDRPEGVLPGEPGPFPSRELAVVNRWQQWIDDHWVQVFAGIVPDRAGQGAIYLIIEGSSNGPSVRERFLTPVAAGAVQILDADSSRVTLTNEGGQIFLFDLSARRFLQ